MSVHVGQAVGLFDNCLVDCIERPCTTEVTELRSAVAARLTD